MLALDNSSSHYTDQPVGIDQACSVAHQSARRRVLTNVINRRDRILRGQSDQTIALRIKKWIVLNDQRARAFFDDGVEVRLQVRGRGRTEYREPATKRVRAH